MDRFYRALRGLCVAAIASVVFATCLAIYDVWWSSQLSGTDTNLPITSAHGLFDLAMQPFFVGSGLLADGACTMGIVLAWLDHRKRWFVALIIVILIVYVGPNLLRVWYNYTAHQPISGWYALLYYGHYSQILTQSLSPLIPVATTLAFARGTQQERIALEADLGITRSAL